jgi:hypothetical protein
MGSYSTPSESEGSIPPNPTTGTWQWITGVNCAKELARLHPYTHARPRRFRLAFQVVSFGQRVATIYAGVSAQWLAKSCEPDEVDPQRRVDHSHWVKSHSCHQTCLNRYASQRDYRETATPHFVGDLGPARTRKSDAPMIADLQCMDTQEAH